MFIEMKKERNLNDFVLGLFHNVLLGPPIYLGREYNAVT